MDVIRDYQKKFITIEKFLFVYKEPVLHSKAFFQKVTLRSAVLLINILTLMDATRNIVACLDNFVWSFFLTHFPPSVALAGGSVILLLSIEHTDLQKAYLGYVLTAIAVWLFTVLWFLSMILTFLSSFSFSFLNLLVFLLIFAFVLYVSWVDYCYAKHLSQGRVELVETGRGDGLVNKEQGPMVNEPANKI